MRIGPDFEHVSALQLRVRALERRVADLESGRACSDLRAQMDAMLKGHSAQVRRLEAERGDAERRLRRMRKSWFEVFEQVERERDEAVRHAQASARRMEERALRAERQRDEYAAKLTEAGVRANIKSPKLANGV